MKQRGSSLLTTLVWIALVTTLGFCLAGLSVHHLFALNEHNRHQEAENAARSVVSQSVERMVKDPDFGTDPNKDSVLHVQLGDAEGQICFKDQDAASLKIPSSLNNLRGSHTIPGFAGRSIPVGSAQIIGMGRSGAITRRVEAIVSIPPFPYALAAAGRIRATGGVTVGGLAKMPTTDTIPNADLIPADVLSNNPDAQAVFLGANTRITGDVRAVGGVAFDPSAPEGSIKIEGAIRSQSQSDKIPTIKLSDYDPKLIDQAYAEVSQAQIPDGLTTLSGVARSQSSLTFGAGVRMDGSVLYVDGDLTIHGGLTGKGVVVVTGKAALDGQTSLTSGTGLALLVGKDLKISGSGAMGSYFQGLVYTGAGFQADKVSLVGTLVARDDADAGRVDLLDSRVIVTPPVQLSDPRRELRVYVTAHGLVGGGMRHQTSGPNPLLRATASGGATVFLQSPTLARTASAGFWMTIRVETRKGQSVVTVTPDPAKNYAPGTSSTTAMEKTQVKTFVQGALGSATPDNLDAFLQFALGDEDGSSVELDSTDPSSFLKMQDRMRIVLWREDL